MIWAEELALDGRDLSDYVGKKINHAVGVGTLVMFKDKSYAISIDLHCDRCLKTYPFFLFDGPSQGDWAYARESQFGPTMDMRNHMLYCDDDCTPFSKEETKALIKVKDSRTGMIEAGKRDTKWVSPAPIMESLAERRLVHKHSTTARGYDIYRLTGKGLALAVWIQSREDA